MAIDFDALVLGPCLQAFGSPATVITARGDAFAISGVFDREHSELTFDSSGAPVSTRKPILGVRSSDYPPHTEILPRDTITVAGSDWQVIDIQPDGQGHVMIALKILRP